MSVHAADSNRFWKGSPDHVSLRLQEAGLSRGATDLLAWSVCALYAVAAAWLPRADVGVQRTLATLLAGGMLMGFVVVMRLRPPSTTRSTPTGTTRPRRVLWIHQNFVTARQAGNSRPVHIVSALLERGWAVDVVTSQT